MTLFASNYPNLLKLTHQTKTHFKWWWTRGLGVSALLVVLLICLPDELGTSIWYWRLMGTSLGVLTPATLWFICEESNTPWINMTGTIMSTLFLLLAQYSLWFEITLSLKLLAIVIWAWMMAFAAVIEHSKLPPEYLRYFQYLIGGWTLGITASFWELAEISYKIHLILAVLSFFILGFACFTRVTSKKED